MSTSDEYHEFLEKELQNALQVANEARSIGEDPVDEVEMDFADDLAERCEKLLDIPNLADKIRKLEEQGYNREETALELAKEFADGEIGESEGQAERIEKAVRTAVAILTEAVVAAPIEGIDGVDIEQNDDGTNYIRIHYAGPIRSAGGTAQALSVLVADYIRQEFGISKFKPRDDEIERVIEEIRIYEDEQNLQYSPSDKEIRDIMNNLPIFIDAEQVSDREVSGYRDLERINGNRARGGMCLVITEGVGLKAAKLQKYTSQMDLEGWDWLSKLPTAASSSSEDEGEDEEEQNIEFKPKKKYIKDLTAGRPVFSHPSAPGGFRLRYGRSRNTGLAASGVNPATMTLVEDFISTGTQLKTERPGKAQGMSPVSGIEGPTVRLHNGTVKRVDSLEEAKEIKEKVDEIIDIGEMAVPYGEFLENNHHLPQSPYVHEWWSQEAKEAGLDADGLNPETLNVQQAINISKKYEIPLHPKYTYLWHDITIDEYVTLCETIKGGDKTDNGMQISPEANEVLEKLLVPHKQNDEDTHLDREQSIILEDACQVENPTEFTSVIEAVNASTDYKVMKRAPMKIGARMARPEKAKQREQNPAIHGLFPVGLEGGSQRNAIEAAEHEENAHADFHGNSTNKTSLNRGEIKTSLSQRRCPRCGKVTWRARCQDCDVRTEPFAVCEKCGTESELDGEGECPECENYIKSYSEQIFDVKEALESALDNVGERKEQFGVIKGVQGLFSNTKVVEPLEKAILRSKHEISIYDDGTVRYDMSDLPLTAFKPEEIGADIERLERLGYTEDIDGAPLENTDQVVELKMQDIVINDRAGETILSIANFVDDLLEKYYGLDPYYDADTKEDLIGELVIGLAPHTSAGVIGRIIGFTKASVGYAHPFFHAAKRRNCDGDEDSVMLLLDGLLNYSEKYLNRGRRGWSMDRPLVMSTHIDPAEIDDEAHNVETVRRLPLEFYKATMANKHPKDVDIKIGEDHIDDVSGFYHSIETESIHAGPRNSAYKTLGDMAEKTSQQLRVSHLVRASDEDDVAQRVIESHFIPDLQGNLRAFSRQDVRCTNCNEKYRRPPLKNKCTNCGADSLILTVHEGSVNKYMQISLDLARKYSMDTYVQQRLEQMEKNMNSLFEDDKEKQADLTDFM